MAPKKDAPTINLAALGISKESLKERIVENVATNILTTLGVVDEDGEEYYADSPTAKKLKALVVQRIDETVTKLAEQHVLPRVSEYIENLTLEQTNKWGEKAGVKLTFIEFLVQRAEQYMTEYVNHEGKTQGQCDRYNWRKTQTRIAHMIDKHLQYHIESAMKTAMQTANSAIATGIAETVKMKLAEIVSTLKISATVKQ